jgi:hypothetical protein
MSQSDNRRPALVEVSGMSGGWRVRRSGGVWRGFLRGRRGFSIPLLLRSYHDCGFGSSLSRSLSFYEPECGTPPIVSYRRY